MSEILEELDFKPLGDGHLATSYRTKFGPFEIEATPGVNLYLQRSYSLHGTVKTGGTMSPIEADLPFDVTSREEGLALVSYFLAQHIPEQHKTPWLRVGERMTSHLPWRR